MPVQGKDRAQRSPPLFFIGGAGGRGPPGWQLARGPHAGLFVWECACRGLASTLALLFTPVNSERAGAEHVGVAAASRSTPSSVLASAPGRLRPEAAAVQSERPHAAFQRQLLVVCALRQQRSSQSDSPRCLPEPRHSARVSQSQASQSPHQRASATRAVVPSFLSFCLFPCTLTSAITAADRTESTDSGDQQ